MVWKTEIIKTDRGNFEIFKMGKGKPLCITHYYSQFSELGNYFADMFIEDFSVHLVNLKEAGNSDKCIQENELSMIESVKDLEAIRMSLGFDTWSFAGHSTGGMLGLVYGIHFPKSLDMLIIAEAAASNEYMSSEKSIYSTKNPLNPRLRELFSIIKSTEMSKEEKAKAGREWTEMSLYRPEKFDQYFARPSSGKVVPIRLDYYSYRELPAFDIRKNLSEIKLPTLILCGRYDNQCSLEFSLEIHEHISSSEIYIFEESNHSPHIEEPNLFKKIIREFRDRNSN